MALVVIVAAAVSGCGGTGGSAGAPIPAPPANPLLGQPNPATLSPVRIGLFNAEGSPLVDLHEVGDSAEAAAAYANDYLGGLGGHRIEIERCADRVDPVQSEACANGFLRDRVVAVVAGQTATADAIVPRIIGAGVPWVGSTPLTTSETGSPDAFFFGAGFIGTLAAWAQYSKDVGYRDVVLYGADTPVFLQAVEALGRPMFDRAGISLRVLPVPLGTTDASSQVEEGLSEDPDAVALLSDTKVCQSLLSALYSARATQPKLVTSACVDQRVMDALGESVIDNAVVFNLGDPSGTHQEAQLYRAVMARYAPDVDPSGITLTGYLTMLGLIRAVGATGLPPGADVSPEAVTAALRAARDVPRPVGNSGTFSCDRSAITTPVVKATICTDELMYTTYTAGLPGRYGKIDVGEIANS